jgi:hypothetical protein
MNQNKKLTFSRLETGTMFVVTDDEGAPVIYEKIHQGRERNARIVLEGLHTTIHPDTTVDAVQPVERWPDGVPATVLAEEDALLFVEDLASMPKESRPAAVEFLLQAIRDELGNDEADRMWNTVAHGGATS